MSLKRTHVLQLLGATFHICPFRSCLLIMLFKYSSILLISKIHLFYWVGYIKYLVIIVDLSVSPSKGFCPFLLLCILLRYNIQKEQKSYIQFNTFLYVYTHITQIKTQNSYENIIFSWESKNAHCRIVFKLQNQSHHSPRRQTSSEEGSLSIMIHLGNKILDTKNQWRGMCLVLFKQIYKKKCTSKNYKNNS